jgi:serine phosphatase RsbU (regulator of sigma subunit)
MIILERPPRGRAPAAKGMVRGPADSYVLLLAALAASALVIGGHSYETRHPAELLLFGGLAAVAGSQKLWVPNSSRSRLSISFIFVLVALLSLGAREAMLIAAAGGLASSVLNVPERPGLRETLFNVSALILSAGLAGLTLRALGRTTGMQVTRGDVLPIFAGALVYFLTNTTLAAIAVSLADRRSAWETWRQGLFWALSGVLAGSSLAMLMRLALGLPDRTLFYLSLPLVYVLFAAYQATQERMFESRRHLEELDRTANELYASFQRVGEALAAPLDTPALHELIVDLCHEMLAPQMSGLCLWRDGALQLAVARFSPSFPSTRSGCVADALRKAAVTALARGQPMSTPSDGLRPGGAGALAFAVPLRSAEQASTQQNWAGALCVLYDPWIRLTGARRQLLTGFATQAALALQNVRLYQREQDVADTMRRSLLPPACVEARDLEIGNFHEPLAIDAGCIGGDYYDVFTLPDGQVVVSIGDVCGKGIEAAVRTALSKYTVRAYAVETPQPHEVLARVNAAMIAQEPDLESFTTLAYALLDPRKGSLAFSVAGHPPALLYRAATGRCVQLDAGGAALGVLPGERYKQVLAPFERRDVLLLYTDGVLEARRGHDEFGLERLETEFARLVRPASGFPRADEIAAALVETARSFADGKLADDVTLLVVKHAGADAAV